MKPTRLRNLMVNIKQRSIIELNCKILHTERITKFIVLNEQQEPTIIIGYPELKKRGIYINYNKVTNRERICFPSSNGCIKATNTMLTKILETYDKVFDDYIHKKDGNPLKNHTIDLIQKPKFGRTRAPNFKGMQDKVELKLQSLLKKGIIAKLPPDKSPQVLSPLMVVPKKNGDIRLVNDFRILNANTQPITGPPVNIWNHLQILGKAQVFSVLDMSDAYYQIHLDSNSQPLTAFIGPRDQMYMFCAMPQGIRNAAHSLSRLLTEIFKNMPYVKCYYDDITVFSQNEEEHLIHLQNTLEILAKNGIKLNKKEITT